MLNKIKDGHKIDSKRRKTFIHNICLLTIYNFISEPHLPYDRNITIKQKTFI